MRAVIREPAGAWDAHPSRSAGRRECTAARPSAQRQSLPWKHKRRCCAPKQVLARAPMRPPHRSSGVRQAMCTPAIGVVHLVAGIQLDGLTLRDGCQHRPHLIGTILPHAHPSHLCVCRNCIIILALLEEGVALADNPTRVRRRPAHERARERASACKW